MAELTRGAFLPPVQYRVRPDPVQNRVKGSCRKENGETLIYLFAWCPVTKYLWNRSKAWLSTAINLPEFSLWNALLGILTETGRDSNMSNTLINHLMLIFKKAMYGMRTSTFPPSIYVLKMRVAKTMKIEYAVAQESNKLDYHLKKWEPLKELHYSTHIERRSASERLRLLFYHFNRSEPTYKCQRMKLLDVITACNQLNVNALN